MRPREGLVSAAGEAGETWGARCCLKGLSQLLTGVGKPFEADGVGDLFPECPTVLRPRVRPGLIQNERAPDFVKRGRVAHFEQENPQPRAGNGGVNFSDEHIPPRS